MYNKLFSKILDSSIWLEAMPTRIVWLTLLATMDQDGFAHFAAIGNLANRARVSLAEAQKAVRTLERPDPESGDDEREGRRIERVPGGWVVLNAVKYRELVTADMRRTQTRDRVRRFRERMRNASVTPANDSVTPSEALALAETERSEDQDPRAGARPVEKLSIKTLRAHLKAAAHRILETNPGICATDFKEEVKLAAVALGADYDGDSIQAILNAVLAEREP